MRLSRPHSLCYRHPLWLVPGMQPQTMGKNYSGCETTKLDLQKQAQTPVSALLRVPQWEASFLLSPVERAFSRTPVIILCSSSHAVCPPPYYTQPEPSFYKPCSTPPGKKQSYAPSHAQSGLGVALLTTPLAVTIAVFFSFVHCPSLKYYMGW